MVAGYYIQRLEEYGTPAQAQRIESHQNLSLSVGDYLQNDFTILKAPDQCWGSVTFWCKSGFADLYL
jgi:hypothetical protein